MSGNEKKSNDDSALKEVGWFTAKTVGMSAAVLGSIAVAVPIIGFTTAGVTAGSLASNFQSAVLGGSIAPGSAFAILQKVGVKGLATGTKMAVVAGSGAIAGLQTIVKMLQEKKKPNKPNSDSDDPTDTTDEENDHGMMVAVKKTPRI